MTRESRIHLPPAPALLGRTTAPKRPTPAPRAATPLCLSASRPAFTLTELLVVLGLIALLLSLLMPVLGKMRAAASATACLANLRVMGTSLTMYTAESKGRLIEYAWHTPKTPDHAWNGYWPGALERFNVKKASLLCPSAPEPLLVEKKKGIGSAAHAWTGRYSTYGTAIRFNADLYRDGSYGYNRYLTANGGFSTGPSAYRLPVRCQTEVPAFLDAAYADVKPVNYSEANPPPSPPHLRGDTLTVASHEHWRFLLARHGRGVNVVMADGSARWVQLEELYRLTWKADWIKYSLRLPRS